MEQTQNSLRFTIPGPEGVHGETVARYAKGGKSMAEYLKDVTDLSTKFAQIGQPPSPGDVNDRILAGLGEEWEPLILALAPSLSTMTTDKLSSLLLNQDTRGSYRQSRVVPPLSGLSTLPPSANVAASSHRRGASRTGRN